jgi:GxxExxY protein
MKKLLIIFSLLSLTPVKGESAMQFDTLSKGVFGCAIEVHRMLGPGLLESAYEACLVHELALARIPFALHAPIPVEYKGIRLDCGYRLDVLVDQKLLIELKSVDQLLGIHAAQILTYMKLTKIPIGLLINFNVELLKNGLRRLVLK